MADLSVDITGDGGVVKRIIRPGTGLDSDKPKKGLEVEVLYIGRFADGNVFDQNQDSFKFKLGVGQVIKGWDRAVATMTKGEKCVITVNPDYAYGVRGAPPRIPPNATLEFEIDLISFADETDVTPDKGVVKKIIKSSEDLLEVTPEYETKCIVNLKIYNTNNPHEVYEEHQQKEIIVGDEWMTSGLEKGICSMKRGEKSLIKITPAYGYGDKGLKKGESEVQIIAPNTHLTYDIELVKFEKEKDSYDMDTYQERKEAALRRKNDGNAYYSKNNFPLAIRKYQKAIEIFLYKSGLSDAELLEVKKDIEVPSNSNIAQCYLKQKDFKKAVEFANKAIELDKTNAKAHWRKGEGLLGLDSLDDAIAAFKVGISIEPNDKALIASLKKAQQQKQKAQEKEKDMWKKAFQ